MRLWSRLRCRKDRLEGWYDGTSHRARWGCSYLGRLWESPPHKTIRGLSPTIRSADSVTVPKDAGMRRHPWCRWRTRSTTFWPSLREGYGQMPPISTRELKDEQVRRVVEYLEILTRGPQRDQAKKSTAWGDPDLQGTWGASGATPMERPDEYQGRATVSDEEVTQIRQATAESDEKYLHAPAQRAVAGGNVGSYNNFWGEPGARSNRTSMIVDPPDGRFPPLTPAGEFAKNNRPRGDDTWEDRHIWERCVTRGGMPNAMFPRWYNNNIQIFQSPGVVAILLEQVHEVRIVPLDAPPPGVIDDWSVERRVVRALGGRDTGRRNDQSRPPGERPCSHGRGSTRTVGLGRV